MPSGRFLVYPVARNEENQPLQLEIVNVVKYGVLWRRQPHRPIEGALSFGLVPLPIPLHQSLVAMALVLTPKQRKVLILAGPHGWDDASVGAAHQALADVV